MKYLINTFLISFYSNVSFSQQPFLLFSPDSSLHIEVKTAGKLSYSLYAGTVLLESSPSVDIELEKYGSLSGNLPVSKQKYLSVNEKVIVPVAYRRKIIAEKYNQLELIFKSPFSVEFRLYNNGLAYRIGLHYRDSVIIKSESALFDMDTKADVWFPHIEKKPGLDRFHTSFEAVYKKEMLSAIPDTMLTFVPVTASLPAGYHIAISDANLFDYPGMFLERSPQGLRAVFAKMPLKEKMIDGEFPQQAVAERTDYLVKTAGTRKLPWRAVLVSKNDIELVANDMIYLLGDASQIKDPSWIKYGKCTDEWITNINLFNVPFKAGINTASYKYYIDFAKRFGLDQVMLDAGWSDGNDLLKVNAALDMNELIAYAKKNNIRLMLWTLCTTLDRQLDSALTQFNTWGIESIMTDFMDRDDAKTVNFYHRIAKACAAHKIAVMFHGAYPPKGLNRTWPNVITHEAVLGSEWNIWSELATPEHDVTLPYTRMLAGPMDYEPGLLVNAQKDQFRAIGRNPMSQGTRCHQLAMFVTYDSPLQIFSGNISQGLLEPSFMELLGSIATTWDETKILQGKIGEYIITARHKGNDWYIAGLNGTTAKEINVSMDFIGTGNYQMVACKDGVNADNYGSDYHLSEQVCTAEQQVAIRMAAGGGFLLKLSKIQ